MPHGLPAAFIEAVLTHFAVAKKCGSWAKEPVIVECLNDWHTVVSCGIVNRGRDEREGVVKMDHIRPKFCKDGRKLLVRGTAPQRLDT